MTDTITISKEDADEANAALAVVDYLKSHRMYGAIITQLHKAGKIADSVLKEMPSVGDVHAPNAGGDEALAGGKKKKKPKGVIPPVVADSPGNLDDTNDMALKRESVGSFEANIAIAKMLPEKRMIFGWASVTHVNGNEIIDKQEDAIQLLDNPADGSKGLESGVYDFVLYSREQGHMHEERNVGKLVESMVFTPEKAALGLVAKNERGEPMMGWWTGFFVQSDAVWKAHKDGKLPELSIGGKATPIDM